MTGLSLASELLRLTKGNIKIGVIEPRTSIITLQSLLSKSLPDKRVYALSPKSIEFYKTLGVWSAIEQRTQTYNTIQVWEQKGPGMLKFTSKDLNTTELGRICEDIALQATLYDYLINNYSNQIDFLFNTSVTNVVVESSKDGTYFTEPAIVTCNTLNKVDKTSTQTTLKCRFVNSTRLILYSTI